MMDVKNPRGLILGRRSQGEKRKGKAGKRKIVDYENEDEEDCESYLTLLKAIEGY